MHLSKECFVRFNTVLVFPLKSFYIEPINKIIFRSTETGLLNKIIHDIDWEIQRIAISNQKQVYNF